MNKHPCTEWSGQPAVYAQQKFDGMYCRVVKQSHLVKCYSSLGNELNVPRRLLLNVLKLVPDGTTLLGELHAPGHPASSVKTYLVNTLLHDKLSLTFFAIETCNADTPLEQIEALCKAYGLPFSSYIVLREGWNSVDLLNNLDKCIEGYVLKDGNLLNWRKLKRKCTVDLLIWGYIPGKGKYAGQVGALIVGTSERHILAQCSGMSDGERKYITSNKAKLLGTVVEVEYQYLGSGGKLRSPQFKRFRDDKWACDCNTSQNEELQSYYDAKTLI